MIYSYDISITGSSHIKNGVVCQDASKVVIAKNGLNIAAIADGVGSCKHSDISSKLAVEVATQYCLDILNNSEGCDLKDVIKQAFLLAELEIEKKSLCDNNPITDYDTTLSMVIYDGTKVTYGHCGDGGIVCLTSEGDYLKTTSPQKKDGIFVVPLRSGLEEWIFGEVESCVSSVLLATDGIYDALFPYLLKTQPVEAYIPLIQYFMDSNCFELSHTTIENIRLERIAFLKSETCASITDDMTIVVLVNGDYKPERKDETFYREPDWEDLKLEWDKKAYPHLYKKE